MISALGHHDASEFVIVRLITDDGIEGVGEATVTPRWSGETVWGTSAIILRLFAPILTGMSCRELDELESVMNQLAVGNWFAKSAIEMACWDILGKAAGKPVFELLGGRVRDLTIRNRFSLGAYAPEIAAQRAERLVADGFTTIKVKVGGDPHLDLARVSAVREAIGTKTDLTIDANGGWDFEKASLFLSQAEPLEILLVEQPLPRGDYTETKRLKDRFGIRILADESCFDEVQLRELIHHQSCDAVTLYPGKQGGIRRAKRMAELASAHNIPCTIGSNLEWDIGAAAMMHFVVSTPNVAVEKIPGDCLGPSYHEFPIVREPIPIAWPFTTLPDRPGLGVDVDWDAVRQNLIE